MTRPASRKRPPRLELLPRTSVGAWTPQIGAEIPDFLADSTQGPISFHDWTEGSWVLLFSHYAAFSPVCTTEVALLAGCTAEFRDRGVKLIGVSGAATAEQLRWHSDIKALYDVEVGYPILEDRTQALSKLLGMAPRLPQAGCSTRKSILLDPARRIRMILEYPVAVGRSIDELLRVIDALQAADAYNIGTPADWQPGEDVLLLPEEFGVPNFDPGPNLREARPYLRSATAPSGKG